MKKFPLLSEPKIIWFPPIKSTLSKKEIHKFLIDVHNRGKYKTN